jgi:hypothetical protein
MKDGYGQQMW